jgi:hypothetical protein
MKMKAIMHFIDFFFSNKILNVVALGNRKLKDSVQRDVMLSFCCDLTSYNRCMCIFTNNPHEMQGKETGRENIETEIRQEVPAINSAHSCVLSCSSTICITLES